MEGGGREEMEGCSCRRIRSDGSFVFFWDFDMHGMLVTGWLSTANQCILPKYFSSLAVLVSCY